MTSQKQDIDWDDILNKLSFNKGTIKSFCEENNISVHQLYYRRKRLRNNAIPSFHGISLKENGSSKQATPSKSFLSSNIKIEIGKAKIYIPDNDKISLSNIIKVLMESC